MHVDFFFWEEDYFFLSKIYLVKVDKTIEKWDSKKLYIKILFYFILFKMCSHACWIKLIFEVVGPSYMFGFTSPQLLGTKCYIPYAI